MRRVLCTSPFVPPEWIAAHGLSPVLPPLLVETASLPAGTRRGVCCYAGALFERVLAENDMAAVVLTTTCDAMRYAAARLEQDGRRALLVNVPSTFEGHGPQRLYADELRRLGRFLETIGGQASRRETLVDVARRYDLARRALRFPNGVLSAARLGAILKTRAEGRRAPGLMAEPVHPSDGGVRLALLGGPLIRASWPLLDRIVGAGGRVVLDATEFGERTLPDALDALKLEEDPIGELARAYFETIPAVFRRPAAAMDAWLDARIAARHVEGIVLIRHVFCDLWHAELHRLRARSGVPILDVDLSDGAASNGRIEGRIEAFLESMRAMR